MSFRQKLAENPIIPIAVTVVIVGIAGWSIFGRTNQPLVEKAYYYDLDQKKLIVGDIGQSPPFTTADGHTAVVAAVFSCDTCDDASSRFVGYLEKYSDELRKAMEVPGEMDPAIARNGHLVRSEADETWIPSSTLPGQELVGSIQKRCGDQQPKACLP